MQVKKELSKVSFKANQAGDTVYLIAYGQHSNNRGEVEFKKTPADVFPPQFRLIFSFLSGKIINVKTKFSVYTSFHSENPVETLTVFDAANVPHEIPVEQTPDFQIDREIKRLLGKKNIRYEKLSAGLASIAHDYETGRLNATLVSPLRMATTQLFTPSAGGTPEVIIFINCAEDAKLDNLPGVKVNSPKGTVRTAKISLDALPALSRRKDVFRLDAAVKCSFLSDEAARKTKLSDFRVEHPELNGEGVIIGIIDSGIDATHPSFSGRILSIWDQEMQGTGWKDETSDERDWGEKRYGQVFTGNCINRSLDKIGHGTHVASIAAGKDDNFNGVAPGADLIIVKTSNNEAHVADAIEYIFSEADRLDKRPAVVNISLANFLNAHDGTDFLSKRIKEISDRAGAGRVIVVAAGNEGDNKNHGFAEIAPGQTTEIKYAILGQAGLIPPLPTFLALSGWYQAHTTCEISVQLPDGRSTQFQPVNDNQVGKQVQLFEIMSQNVLRDVLRVTVTTPSAPTNNDDHEFSITIESLNSTGLPNNPSWKIIVRNTGTENANVHIWGLVPASYPEVRFLPDFSRDDMKIGSPGCADEVITVAAYTTRTVWKDISGNEHPPVEAELEPNTVWKRSSSGPKRNSDVKKPDIAAPGAMIISALSSSSEPALRFRTSDGFVIREGTSMACPFITGVCALLLQRDNTLTTDQIKELFKKNGRIPDKDPETHDIKWGYGLIDVSSL